MWSNTDNYLVLTDKQYTSMKRSETIPNTHYSIRNITFLFVDDKVFELFAALIERISDWTSGRL